MLKLLFVGTLVLGLLARPATAGDLWGYVDAQGHPHISTTPLDQRYQLFFKGDPEASPRRAQSLIDPVERATRAAIDAFKHTAAFQRIERRPALARFERLIDEHAARRDVDPALVKAVVATESGFEPSAVSARGALGLMQLLPETAARYGLVADPKRSLEQKLLDPAINLRIGIRYLSDLMARFSNDLELSLAAYNAGEMAVERYHNRVPPYRETQDYVKRVQQFYAAYRPPLAASAPLRTARVPGRRPLSGDHRDWSFGPEANDREVGKPLRGRV